MVEPTAENITQLREWLSTLWSPTHTVWETIDTFVQLTYPVWTKAEHVDRPFIRPPDAARVIDSASDNNLAFLPKVSRIPTGKEQSDEEAADALEPAVEAIFKQTQLMEPTLTWKQAGRHLISYGYTVIEGPTWTNRDKPEKPVKKRGESEEDFKGRQTIFQNEKRSWMPLRIRAPHPARVLLNPNDKRPKEGVKVIKRLRTDIKDLLDARLTGGKGKNKDASNRRSGAVAHLPIITDLGLNPYEMLETTEYWSRDWHAMLVEDDLLFKEANIWRLMPWKHAFATFGQEVTNMENESPSNLAVGILGNVLETIRAHAQEVSSRHNAYVNAGFNDRVTTMDAAELRDQLSRGDGIIEIQKGIDLDWMKLPDFPSWMMESEARLLDAIERDTGSQALSGIRQVGVSTVGQQAINTTMAARKYDGPSIQLEQLATHVGEDILRLVDVMGEDLTVRGRAFGPKQIEHDYSLTVEFPQVDPVLQLQERQIAMQEFQMRLLDKSGYWSRTKTENATEIQQGLVEDLVREHPLVANQVAAEIAKQLGFIELAEALKQAAMQTARPQAQQAALGGGANMASAGGTELREALTPNVQQPAQTGVAPGI